MRKCSECDRAYVAKGYCWKHYMRVRNTGSPHLLNKQSEEERFLSFFKRGQGCWEWRGATNGTGYGKFTTSSTPDALCAIVYAHRYAYEKYVGPIPDKFQIDHLCKNRRCVNPKHLESVTAAENMRRTRKAVCFRGHPRVPPNLRRNSFKGAMYCRACANVTQQARRSRGY